MCRIIIYHLCFLSTALCTVEVVGNLSFYDINGGNMNSPAISVDGSYVSVEIDSKDRSGKVVAKNIGFINLSSGDPDPSAIGYLMKKSVKKKKNIPVRAKNIVWSKDDEFPDEFYYLSYNKSKSVWEIYDGAVSDGDDVIDANQGDRINDDSNTLGDRIFPEAIYYYDTQKYDGYDEHLIVYRSGYEIKTHFSIDEFEKNNFKLNVESDKNVLEKPDEIIFNNIDDDECSVVLSVSGAGDSFSTENDLIFFSMYDDYNMPDGSDANIYQREEYGFKNYLFPRDDKHYSPSDGMHVPFGNQFKPRFNHDGTLVAYLSQDTDKSNERFFDLYIYDRNYDTCNDGMDDVIDIVAQNANESRLIDSDLATWEWWESQIGFHNDYLWHPEENILFYVKRFKDGNDLSYRIMYYNVDTDESGALDINTQRNRDLAISDDGKYLLYIYNGMVGGSDYDFFDNCSGREDCTKVTTTWNLGIAEIETY